MNRREFVQWGAALSFAGVAQSTGADEVSFAGCLTRMAFLDDIAALAAAAGQVPAPIARAILSNHALFMAGSGIDAAQPANQQALVISASRAAAAAYSALEHASEAMRLQRDARLLRELAARAGQVGVSAQARDVSSLFDTMSRRVLIGIHTYIPDGNDVEGWMERLIRLHEAARYYFNRLGEAFQQARAAAVAFYDSNDSIVRAASSIQYGPLSRAAAQQSLLAKPKSAYGTALLDAHTRLIAIRTAETP
jgi:hypothetical protein